MKKEFLLSEIAATGYNVLYSAKKHFATYDIVEKVPGWITIFTLGIGIFALVFPTLNNNAVGAAILIVGIASIYFNPFQHQKASYGEVGATLITHFNMLRHLYYEVQSRGEDDSLDDLEERYQVVLAESQKVWLHRHIFLSDWYTHYKIFWQAQIGWLDEQLHFKFCRDKVPLTLLLAAAALFLSGVLLAAERYLSGGGCI